MNTSILAQQLIARNKSEPEKVVANLLQELADMHHTLNQLQVVVQVEPAANPQHKRMLLQQSITVASLRMYRVFHQCRVPNAILTKVQFPDGLYELTFTKLKVQDETN